MVESLVESPPSPQPPAETAREGALTDLELTLLLEAVVRFSGYDFREYSQATLKRRVTERMRAEGARTISGLLEKVLHDPPAFARFMMAMSGGQGTLFRDPEFFAAFRRRVVPLMRTYSFVRVWLPNCARGEDAYSIAAILHEEGLLSRTMIYATDASELAISTAKRGVFDLESPEALRASHRATGSNGSLSELGTIAGDRFRFKPDFQKNVIFAQHSLVTDGSLNEFHAIVARGILPQFNKALQFRVHNLLLNSLLRLGFFCLGANESLRQTPHERVFRLLAEGEPIYRRMR